MQKCISFLRSVNMVGHNLIKMTELSALYSDLGHHDAITYIQSGNVIFSNPENLSSLQLSTKVEKAVLEKFGLNIRVITRTVSELESLLELNPYLELPGFNPSKMAVIFLHEEVSEAQVRKVEDVSYPPDQFTINGKDIFIYCPNGFGKSKIYTVFFEKKMGVTGTARNWNTVTTLIKMANKT